jgi:chromosome segregation ATPase
MITPSNWGELWDQQQQRNKELHQNYTNLSAQVQNLQGEQTAIHRRLDTLGQDVHKIQLSLAENTELTKSSIELLTGLRDAKITITTGTKFVKFIGAAVIGAAGFYAAIKTFLPHIKLP